MFTVFILGAILKFIKRKMEVVDYSEISDVGLGTCPAAKRTTLSQTSLVE